MIKTPDKVCSTKLLRKRSIRENKLLKMRNILSQTGFYHSFILLVPPLALKNHYVGQNLITIAHTNLICCILVMDTKPSSNTKLDIKYSNDTTRIFLAFPGRLFY